MFAHFIKNNLICPNQTGFKPGDSLINQLLFITHEIYQSFNDGFEVKNIFADISKAFDKAWNKGRVYKLEVTQDTQSTQILRPQVHELP